MWRLKKNFLNKYKMNKVDKQLTLNEDSFGELQEHGRGLVARAREAFEEANDFPEDEKIFREKENVEGLMLQLRKDIDGDGADGIDAQITLAEFQGAVEELEALLALKDGENLPEVNHGHIDLGNVIDLAEHDAHEEDDDDESYLDIAA